MVAIHPKPGLRTLDWTHQTADRHVGGSGVRGRGVLLGDGSYLFVGVSDYQLEEVREVVTRTFAVGLAATIILAIAGGIAMSQGVLRRVENVSRASRAIMAGDLGLRMTLRGTEDEFDHLSGSLNAMLDRIQALMLGLQQMSNDIAHDLRTPLTRLRQRLELAQRRETTVEGFRAALDGAIANAEEILETFGALLRIAQIEAGTRRAGFGPVRLDILFTDLVEAYQPVAEEKEQILRGRIEPALNLHGDKELLTLLFANLIENAIRHCPSGSLIEVGAERRGVGIAAWVADNGPGIPAAYHEKVLQRFYRLEASRTMPGNGLGLSAVVAIATLHGAPLVLEDNQPGLRCVLDFRPDGDA
jgi:signal transduction histidine kinase